jgi:hypothetical protein
MKHFLDWFVPALKFAAIFISGASGILALIVEFKDKHQHITPWGRRAVIMVVASFLVSAVMQAIEIHQDHQKETAQNQKTQNILNNIDRQLYNIDESSISFDVTSTLKINNRLFKPYYEKLFAYGRYVIAHPTMNIPKGIDTVFINNQRIGKKQLDGLIILPDSPLYPDSVKQKQVYSLIGQIMLASGVSAL